MVYRYRAVQTPAFLAENKMHEKNVGLGACARMSARGQMLCGEDGTRSILLRRFAIFK